MKHNGIYGGDRAQHGVSYHGHQDGHQQHPGIAHSDPRGGNSKSMEMEAGRTLGSDRSGEDLQEEINRLQKRLDEQKGKSWTKRSVDVGYWQFPEGEGNESRREEKGSTEETLRSVPITLPKLVDPSVKNASLEAGDWIAQIKPYVSDVAPGASAWWENLMRLVMERYNEWLQANPLERVYLTPPDRVTTLLLGALPETLRTELVTTRQLTVSGAMFSVMKRYQPGGVAERSQTLMELTSTKSAASPLVAVQQLRLWKRQKNRALELGLALPDLLILVRAAVDNIMRDLLGRHQEASFRVSAFRMQHQLDVRPTLESLAHFHDLLLAEADQMLYGRTEEEEEKTQSTPAVKAMTSATRSSPSTKTLGPCRFWGNDAGCKLGAACRYNHDWQGVSDRSSRCWTCSSKEHMRSECPSRSAAFSKAGGSERTWRTRRE